MMGPMSSSLRAEISSIATTVGELRRRVASMASPLLGTDRDDLVAALYEAERGLVAAGRHLDRAEGLVR